MEGKEQNTEEVIPMSFFRKSCHVCLSAFE